MSQTHSSCCARRVVSLRFESPPASLDSANKMHIAVVLAWFSPISLSYSPVTEYDFLWNIFHQTRWWRQDEMPSEWNRREIILAADAKQNMVPYFNSTVNSHTHTQNMWLLCGALPINICTLAKKFKMKCLYMKLKRGLESHYDVQKKVRFDTVDEIRPRKESLCVNVRFSQSVSVCLRDKSYSFTENLKCK